MTSVYGDVQAGDEFTHPAGPESNFNESAYFNFFDRSSGYGGFLRIGNRVNEGYAEVTVCLFLPDGQVMFSYRKPEITDNDAFRAGGMTFEVMEPLAKHRTLYEGTAVYLTDPSQMTEPRKAFLENPHKKVAVDLTHEAVGPVYGSAGAGRENADPETEFARAHYEQHMQVSGALVIDGKTIKIDALGLRDHSWGPRYWQALKSYRWLTCAFGPDFGVMVSEIELHEGALIQNAIVVRGESLVRAGKVDVETDYQRGTTYQRRMTATLGLEGGKRLVLEGEVKGFIPLRNRRAGMVTQIGEGMTEYRCEGRVGTGISEYLDQIQ